MLKSNIYSVADEITDLFLNGIYNMSTKVMFV